MAEFSCCLLCWRWVQGQAVTGENSSVPQPPSHPTSRLSCGDYRGASRAGCPRGGGGTEASRHARAGGIFIHLAQGGNRSSGFAPAGRWAAPGSLCLREATFLPRVSTFSSLPSKCH